MILEHFMPGKLRVNSPKIALASGFFPWTASKSEVTLILNATEVERRYNLHLTTDEARAMRDHLNRAISSSEGMAQAEEVRATIAQVERALG